MLRFWKKKSRVGKIELPDDSELLAFLDGQLGPERHGEIEKLKEESWELRLRLAEMSQDIETYTKATLTLVPDETPPFEAFWEGIPTEDPLPEGQFRKRAQDEGEQSTIPIPSADWLPIENAPSGSAAWGSGCFGDRCNCSCDPYLLSSPCLSPRILEPFDECRGTKNQKSS